MAQRQKNRPLPETSFDLSSGGWWQGETAIEAGKPRADTLAGKPGTAYTVSTCGRLATAMAILLVLLLVLVLLTCCVQVLLGYLAWGRVLHKLHCACSLSAIC